MVVILLLVDAVLGYQGLPPLCVPIDRPAREVADCARAEHRAHVFAVAFQWSLFVTVVAVAYTGVSLRRRKRADSHDDP